MMSGALRLNRGVSWLGLKGSMTSLKKRSEKFVSQAAVGLAMCGLGLSVFCTRQLTDKPSSCSVLGKKK